jgi:DNA repair and recombination protein RAD54B
MLKGALEEKIWQRQVTKIGLADSVMESKSSNMAQFSREELKDLFRLYEAKACQTHELLNCRCGGKGIPPSPPPPAPFTPVHISLLGEDEEDDKSEILDSPETAPEKARSISPFWKDEELSDSEDIDFPDLHTLTKASKVNIEEQENQIKRGKHALQQNSKQKKTNTKTTAITSSKLLSSRKRKSRKDDDDEDEEEAGSTEQSKIQRFLAEYAHIDPAAFRSSCGDDETEVDDIKNHIDDPILQALLADEDHGIGFLFQKTAFPATSSPAPIDGAKKASA